MWLTMKKLLINKTNLDIFWLKDESLEDMENLPDFGIFAHEITHKLSINIDLK
jgi:type I restriction enzyme M protein